MEKKRDIDFTTGSPSKLILSFYWPLLLTSMLQQVYNFVDSLIVGKGLGDNAFGAVGNMSSIFFLIVGFSFGLANGFGVLVAHSYGAKEFDLLRHRVGAIIQLGAVLAIALTTISLLILPTILKLMQTDEAIISDSLKYGNIVFGGVVAGISFNISAALLRAFGDSQTPLHAMIGSSIINIFLDSLFIFGFHTGVEGAAIATVCAQVVSAFICINQLRKIDFLKLTRSDFNNAPKIYGDLLKNGLPMAFMNSITAIGCMVVQGFVNAYGPIYTAAYAACSKYLNLFMNPAATAGSAITAYTSQNYGAKQIKRIKEGLQVSFWIIFVGYLILGSIMFFLPRQLADILLDGSKQIDLVCILLPRCGVMLIILNILFIVRAAVQGMGKPMLPMLSGILEMILRTAVISVFLSRIGFAATAYAEISAWTGALLVNALALYIELYKRKL